MTRVLVIGAGGVFGSRLCEGLLRNGFEVVAAGRNLARAEAVAADLRRAFPGGGVEAAALDTGRLTVESLRATGAAIVADMAGPFQAAEPTTARAAIAAGLHYVDLADGRDFVPAFPALDSAAKAAGVVALTGCSSTPALSNAVLDHLTDRWREIVSVEAAISPGARAPRGLSVMQAILSWLGRPVRVFDDGGWTTRPGWSGLYRRDFGAAGRRRVSLCETPDLDLFSARFEPSDRALFLAGLEPWPAHLGAWLLGRMVRLFRFDPTPLAGLLIRLSGWAAPFGSDRGAMRVEAYGVDGDGRAVRAVWRLAAEPGEGPVTPSLPALAAIKAIAAGQVAPGARPCVGVLSLEAVVAEMAPYGLATEIIVEGGATYARAIGPAFDDLPEAIRTLHETPGRSVWRGDATTEGAAGPLAAAVARLIGFPKAQTGCPAEVEIDANGDRSVWRRRIGGHAFSSVLSRPRRGGRVSERFGLLTMDLRLTPEDGRLVYRVEGWRLGPVPLPRALAPSTRAHETVDELGRFVFDVEISAPLIGRLVHYRGSLVRVDQPRLRTNTVPAE
ncbi:saccharopine dehydrogenase-like NADP-dependent oxidoreductase [Brevundimonas alba]|uniref:Saccharopine dehydrogenase-like NADP-dependent oxidoreductase n=1 Tax=Brevundimonas alba TaxID=74314 RepID=A0A7X5YI77_9CAUL|nr:SDR family oxidoreductase [Brevundimonas alba]NJC40052.1 saccharopine dehydrogenase-like NADP-dependent oxidoreductase [Brevundimonas alba]